MHTAWNVTQQTLQQLSEESKLEKEASWKEKYFRGILGAIIIVEGKRDQRDYAPVLADAYPVAPQHAK